MVIILLVELLLISSIDFILSFANGRNITQQEEFVIRQQQCVTFPLLQRRWGKYPFPFPSQRSAARVVHGRRPCDKSYKRRIQYNIKGSHIALQRLGQTISLFTHLHLRSSIRRWQQIELYRCFSYVLFQPRKRSKCTRNRTSQVQTHI